MRSNWWLVYLIPLIIVFPSFSALYISVSCFVLISHALSYTAKTLNELKHTCENHQACSHSNSNAFKNPQSIRFSCQNRSSAVDIQINWITDISFCVLPLCISIVLPYLHVFSCHLTLCISTCPHVRARCYPLTTRGNERRFFSYDPHRRKQFHKRLPWFSTDSWRKMLPTFCSTHSHLMIMFTRFDIHVIHCWPPIQLGGQLHVPWSNASSDASMSKTVWFY